MTMIVSVVLGERACFCGPACRDGFRADRMHGLIFQSTPCGDRMLSIEAASLNFRYCAYCGAKEKRRGEVQVQS